MKTGDRSPDILAALKRARAASHPALATCAAIGRGAPLATFFRSASDAIPLLESGLRAFEDGGGQRSGDLSPAARAWPALPSPSRSTSGSLDRNLGESVM
jgi:hypothetical protein